MIVFMTDVKAPATLSRLYLETMMMYLLLMDLSRKILADPVNKWVFSYAKKDIFLVGGYIRDLIRGGFINRDKDYVLKDNIREIALRASNQFNGTFIELKKDITCRVALKNGQFLDFSRMTHSIIDDLNNRDFRINSIAWCPEKGIIDPLCGERDIKNKIIRVVKPENLKKDPLRILRSYRLSAQLGFTIDRYTRNYLRKYAARIKETAAERITEEFIKLLDTENAFHYISLIVQDNVLQEVLHASRRKLKHNTELIGKFDLFIMKLQRGKSKKLFNSRISPVLNVHIGQGIKRSGLIRLSILLHNLYRAKDNPLGKLKFSKSVMKRISIIQEVINTGTGKISEAKLYDIFSIANDCEYEAALILSLTRQRNVDKLLKRAADAIKIKNNLLLDGYEIQNILNIKPASLIGKIQAEIQKKRFLGIIRTKNQAKHWTVSNFT